MSEEGFLSRWSRRKRAIDSGDPVAEPAPIEPVRLDAPLPPVPPEPPFDIATLPPVDTLTIDSDFTAFLRKEVPEVLKRAALRKAWALDPAIRDFVGPADYAWDYNAPDGVPGASLNLTGNIKDMLAQAFGSPEEEVAPPAAAAEIAGPAPAPVEEDLPPPAPVALAQAEPAPEIWEGPATPLRRHGSALPS